MQSSNQSQQQQVFQLKSMFPQASITIVEELLSILFIKKKNSYAKFNFNFPGYDLLNCIQIAGKGRNG